MNSSENIVEWQAQLLRFNPGHYNKDSPPSEAQSMAAKFFNITTVTIEKCTVHDTRIPQCLHARLKPQCSNPLLVITPFESKQHNGSFKDLFEARMNAHITQGNRCWRRTQLKACTGNVTEAKYILSLPELLTIEVQSTQGSSEFPEMDFPPEILPLGKEGIHVKLAL